MDKHVIIEHAKACDDYYDGRSHRYCGQTTFCFQLKYQFHVLLYPSCLEGCAHLDFKQQFINAGCEHFNLKEIDRGVVLEKERKLKKDIIMRNPIMEVSHVYYAYNGKAYGFVNTMSFGEFIIYNASYFNNHQSALKEVQADQLLKEFHLEINQQIDDLWLQNSHDISWLQEYQVLQLNDLIIKNIITNARNNGTEGPAESSRRHINKKSKQPDSCGPGKC